jgi:hypothetical protein
MLPTALICIQLLLSGKVAHVGALYQSQERAMTRLTISNPVQLVNLSSSNVHSFCFSDHQNFRISDVFREVSIEVRKTSPSGAEFPWFSVRGVSTDDFHENLENMVFNMVRVGDDERTIYHTPTHEKKSVVRDLLSSCPNPIFSSDRSKCRMTFSPFGEACVTIRAERAMSITASLDRYQNPKLVLRLLCGALLLYLAHPFSKSKIFQVCYSLYTVCSLNFKSQSYY